MQGGRIETDCIFKIHNIWFFFLVKIFYGSAKNCGSMNINNPELSKQLSNDFRFNSRTGLQRLTCWQIRRRIIFFQHNPIKRCMVLNIFVMYNAHNRSSIVELQTNLWASFLIVVKNQFQCAGWPANSVRGYQLSLATWFVAGGCFVRS